MVAPLSGGPVASLIISSALFGLQDNIYIVYAGVANLDYDCTLVLVMTKLGYMGFLIRIIRFISTTTFRVRR